MPANSTNNELAIESEIWIQLDRRRGDRGYRAARAVLIWRAASLTDSPLRSAG